MRSYPCSTPTLLSVLQPIRIRQNKLAWDKHTYIWAVYEPESKYNNFKGDTMKRFLYTLIQWTWGFPQNFVGLLMFIGCKIAKCKSKKYKNAIETKWDNKYGSVSLGMFIFLDNDKDETLAAHEYGHSIQSLILGVFYLFVIGIPSFCWAVFGSKYRTKHNKTYYEFYTESWANKIAGLDKFRFFIGEVKGKEAKL